MKKPRILDLFCGAGGASMGYHRAGFEVEGVDIKPQKNYPFKFYQADALEFPLEGYDAFHASPPCQRYSRLTPPECRWLHDDLISPTRHLLYSTGKPYVIENVSGASKLLINPIMLCGTMFGLELWRHRYFETKPQIDWLTIKCNHSIIPVLISGSPRRNGSRKEPSTERRREAMKIDWMTRTDLDQAIPPAYTEYIGKYLIYKGGD